MSPNVPFERGADAYDAWYDTEYGVAVLRAETACLRRLLTQPGPAIEVGAGSGRFTEALRVSCGVEPAAAMVAIAARRGLPVVRGVGEALPVRSEVAGHVVLVTALEFVDDPARVCAEAARVLRPRGQLVVGFIPATGPWAAQYRRAGEAGDPVFSTARFYGPGDVIALAGAAGLTPADACSALLDVPSAPPGQSIADGAVGHAGFCAMSFARPGA